MLCTGLFPNADTKIQHRRSPTCPLWYDKYQLCSIWLNYVYFCTQAYAADYPSGSISLPKWLNQTTQVAQSDYSSGSIRLLKWLNQRVQPSAQASTAVCVTQFSHILNPVQPLQLVNGSTSFVYLI